MIVTFYSFKGGVGRSMALANCAQILVERGFEVIVCDWDLEAPGLERYLTDADDEVEALRAQPGVVDLLVEYREAVSRPPDAEPPGELSAEHYRVGDTDLRRPSSYARKVGPSSEAGGQLRFLSAGGRSGDDEARFVRRVEAFDWAEFYDRWSGASYVEFFRQELLGELDEEPSARDRVILVDARTGFTEHGGVCTHHLADLVVVLFAANELNIEGAEWIANRLSSDKLVAERGGRSLGVLPVPARVEQVRTEQGAASVSRQSRRAPRHLRPAGSSWE